MHRYWLLDQHDGEGPTALVETDGSLHIVDIVRFGPDVTAVEQQQDLWDRLIGRVAPTMKPLVEAASLDVEGVRPSAKLDRGDRAAARSTRRGAPAGSSGRRPAARGRRGEGRGHSGHR